MNKLVLTIALIVTYVPLEVLSDGKLQEMADIVKNINTTRLCNHDCKPVVTIDGTNLTVSYETQFACTEDAGEI